MPSEAFMKNVLETGRAQPLEPEEEVEELPEQEPEVEAPDQGAPGDQPAEEAEEEAPQEPAEGEPEAEEEEAEEEADTSQEGEPAYAGSWEDHFDSPEALFRELQTASKRVTDTRAWGQHLSREVADLRRRDQERDQEMAELREALAYQTGRYETTAQRGGGDDGFNEWVEEQLDENAVQGFMQIQEHARATGEWDRAHDYVDAWGQRDPYLAADAKNTLRMEQATLRMQQQREAQQQPQEQEDIGQVRSQVVADVLEQLREYYPDLQDGSTVLSGVVGMIRDDQTLLSALQSADYVAVTNAITSARERYMSGQRPNGRRRVASGAAAELAAAKTRATTATGDRPPPRSPSPAEQLPAELQGAFDVFQSWGQVRRQDD